MMIPIGGHYWSIWIIIGLTFFLAGAVSATFVRFRLRRAGLAVKHFGTIGSNIAEHKLYLHESAGRGWSKWPVYWTIFCLLVGLALLIGYAESKPSLSHQHRTDRGIP
jgi:hypothetical protein